jgi:plastocyanin
MTSKALVLILLLLVSVAIIGCGNEQTTGESRGEATGGNEATRGEHPGSEAYGSPPLEFEADPGGKLAYTTDEVTAKEGNVTIEFTNPQSVPHNVTVEAKGDGRVKTKVVANGFAAVTVTLDKEQDFIFYCSVPGHRKAGMEGTINVE